MNFVSYAQLAQDVRNWSLPDDIGLVVGVPRSGLIVAIMLAQRFNCAVSSIEWPEPCTDVSRRPIVEGSRILLVDDSVRSGRSMDKAKDLLSKRFDRFDTAAVYCAKPQACKVDHVCRYLGTPRLFQWNCLNHSILRRACVDIDGVLCRDPVKAEWMDPRLYGKFVREVKPLVTPRYPILALVTWRPESMRKNTAEWLHTAGIRYKHLYMRPESLGDTPGVPAATKGLWKAKVYRKVKADIFIESSDAIAAHISKKARKRVLSTQSWRLF